MRNRIAIWLEQASHEDNIDKLILRCKVAANEIDRLEARVQSRELERDFAQRELNRLNQRRGFKWKNLFSTQ